MRTKFQKKDYYPQHIVNMVKKIRITESKFQDIINEELSIARETVEMSKNIINTILKHIEQNENTFIFDSLYNTKVDVIIYQFKNNRELSDWLDNNGSNKLFNGFSFKENTFYIRGVKVGDDIDMTVIENNVFHEVEHFVQSLKKGKPLTAKGYEMIAKHMNNDDIVVSFVCKLLYFTTKFELDACINGFYSDLNKFDLGRTTLAEILNQTECGMLLYNLNDWENKLNKWAKTPIINIGRIKLFNLGIVKYTNIEDLKSHLLKRLYKAQRYLLKRIGKVYALSKKVHDCSINESLEKDIDNNLYRHDGTYKRIKMSDTESIINIKGIFRKYE